MATYGFDHIHLMTPNTQATADFYEKVLGAKNIGTRKLGDGRTMVSLMLDKTVINVMDQRAQPLVPGASLTGLEHFGLKTNNIEAAVKELKAKGVKFVKEVQETSPGTKIAFFLGPENVPIELLQRPG